MTEQEAFTVVVLHSRKQQCKSEDGSRCMYRGLNGTMCFGGCLIPDDDYRSNMEGYSASNNNLRNVFQKQGLGPDWVRELQRIHDECGVEQWEKQLALFAKKYHLEMPS